jgi:UV DNA damage endonuclease
MAIAHIRFGLCCIFRREPIRFRTTTARALRPLPRAERLARLSALCHGNAASLVQALEACIQLSIGAFRILSPLFPLFTHPEVGYRLEDLPEAAEIGALMTRAAHVAATRGLRLSLHPDQFVLLNSPRPEVVAGSIAELEYQGLLAALTGAEAINIHLGGVYGDKPAAMARFRNVFAKLPEGLRRRISLENDDISYSPADLLPLARELSIPLVYDRHHHRCLPDRLGEAQATVQCAATWQALGREPWFHLSSPRAGWSGGNPRPHADFIDPADFPPDWRTLDFPFTVDIEAKAKELAVVALREALAAAC